MASRRRDPAHRPRCRRIWAPVEDSWLNLRVVFKHSRVRNCLFFWLDEVFAKDSCPKAVRRKPPERICASSTKWLFPLTQSLERSLIASSNRPTWNRRGRDPPHRSGILMRRQTMRPFSVFGSLRFSRISRLALSRRSDESPIYGPICALPCAHGTVPFMLSLRNSIQTP